MPTRSATAATAACSSAAGAAASSLLLQVWDTGPGIAADEQRRIFDEFYQVPGDTPPTADQKKGLGLGLAIVKRLAALIGEPLALRSVPGRGSVFTLGCRPPARRGGPTCPRPARLRPGSRWRADPSSSSKTIPPCAWAWRCCCRAGAQACSRFDSFAAALRAAEASPVRPAPPDLLIVDYRLELGHTGVEAIAALRAAWGSACRRSSSPAA